MLVAHSAFVEIDEGADTYTRRNCLFSLFLFLNSPRATRGEKTPKGAAAGAGFVKYIVVLLVPGYSHDTICVLATKTKPPLALANGEVLVDIFTARLVKVVQSSSVVCTVAVPG
jgi:hypothetical protein